MHAALLASLLLSQVAPEQAKERELIFVQDVRAAETCRPDSAVPTPFERDRLVAQDCVTIGGLWLNNQFYRDLDAYYRRPRFLGDPDIEQTALGVYGWRDRIAPPVRPTPARLTGRLGRCDDLYGPDVVMVAGYCHYTGGPYVALGEAETTGPVPERLTGAAHRARLGHLVALPVDSPDVAYAEGRARRWLALVRAGDAAAYANGQELVWREGDLEDPDSELHAVFRAPDSVFERLRTEADPALKLWAIPQPARDADEPPVDPRELVVLACFRLGAWTDDRWPVSPVDADNAPSRPYACVQLIRQFEDDGQALEYHALDFGGPGLAEPAWD